MRHLKVNMRILVMFPFLDRAFNPTKDKLIAECDDDGTRFDYWVDWETGKVELFDILSRY